MPIICIDVVIMIENKVFLIKRDKEPAKNEYWFPGGRLIKNENVREAVGRIVKAETNLSIINQVYLDFVAVCLRYQPFAFAHRGFERAGPYPRCGNLRRDRDIAVDAAIWRFNSLFPFFFRWHNFSFQEVKSRS